MGNRYFICTPNIITVISLVGLCFALLAIKAMIGGEYNLAIGYLLLAMGFDFIDGPIARRLNKTTEFGRYLDSFIDTVDYLIAPSIFIFLRGFSSVWEQLVLFVFVVSGVIRLSVFNQIGNVGSEQGVPGYLGLPVFWSVWLIATFQLTYQIYEVALIRYSLLFLILAMAVAMVSNARFLKFKNWKLIFTINVLLSIYFIGQDRPVLLFN